MDEPLHQRLDREAAPLWIKPRSEVRNQLVEHYLPFAELLASRKAAQNPRVDKDDCYQEACFALINAVNAYDIDNPNGASFTTFASLRVNGGAIEAERNNDWVNHKVRAAHGESLPKMGHFKDGFGESRAEELDADEPGYQVILERLLDVMPPQHAKRIEGFLACGGDIDEWAKAEGIGVPHARLLLTAAVVAAQRIPTDEDGEISRLSVEDQARGRLIRSAA